MEINSIEFLRKAKDIGATHFVQLDFGDYTLQRLDKDEVWFDIIKIDGVDIWKKSTSHNAMFFSKNSIEIDFSPIEVRAAPRDLPSDTTEVDMVTHPPHYQSHNGVECLDAIEAALGLDGYIAYLRGQVIKYTWRLEKKWDAVEDAKKTSFYNDRLIKKLEERANDTTISD